MSAPAAPAPCRVLRADRCRCSEYPQAHYDARRGASWFSCSCGRISREAQDLGAAIDRWNELIWRGEC